MNQCQCLPRLTKWSLKFVQQNPHKNSGIKRHARSLHLSADHHHRKRSTAAQSVCACVGMWLLSMFFQGGVVCCVRVVFAASWPSFCFGEADWARNYCFSKPLLFEPMACGKGTGVLPLLALVSRTSCSPYSAQHVSASPHRSGMAGCYGACTALPTWYCLQILCWGHC